MQYIGQPTRRLLSDTEDNQEYGRKIEELFFMNITSEAPEIP